MPQRVLEEKGAGHIQNPAKGANESLTRLWAEFENNFCRFVRLIRYSIKVLSQFILPAKARCCIRPAALISGCGGLGGIGLPVKGCADLIKHQQPPPQRRHRPGVFYLPTL